MNIANKKRRAALGDVSNEVGVQKHAPKRKCTALKKSTSSAVVKKSAKKNVSSETEIPKLNVTLRSVDKSKVLPKMKITHHQKPATSRKDCNVTKLCSPIQKLCVAKSSKEKSSCKKSAISGKARLQTLSSSSVTSSSSGAIDHPPSDAKAFTEHTSNDTQAPITEFSSDVAHTESLKDPMEDQVVQKVVPKKSTNQQLTTKCEWVDIDSQQHNPYYMSDYVNDIFEHYRKRELQHLVPDYMHQQDEINGDLRMVLVDWLVEVQQSFLLNHESLYIAVKLIDLYASRRPISKSRLQLLGAVALNLAAKFDERCPPVVDDFVFICDDAYSKQEFLQMEMEVLAVCDFNVSLPLSYTFLRRYATCARVGVETLTLSRFYLESSLLYYNFVTCLESKMAAACLFIAMCINKESSWDGTLKHYTGYEVKDVSDQVLAINQAVNTTPHHVSTILSKYSHPTFLEVATKERLTEQQLRASL